MKKHPILVLVFTLALSVNLNAQKIPALKPLKELPGTLIPFEKKGEWGYADQKGKTVIKAVFDAAEEFHPVTSEGVTMEVAKICVNGKWGFITKENVYLFPPSYDNLTDFDKEGNAVGTCEGFMSLLGVHPALNERKTFETLAGSILKLNLTDIGPFNEYGIAKASELSKWGLLNRKGSWVLPAGYDSIEEEYGMFFISRNGDVGIAALDGSVQVEPVYEDLVWNPEKELFTALKDGKYGILYKNGKSRYPCIFDQVPVESERGYVEMWEGDTPALFIPDDRLYTVDEYDENLFRNNPSYASASILPNWMKKHLESVGLVRVVSDLRKKDEVDVSAYQDWDYSVFSNIMLKCGRLLSEVMTEFARDPVNPESLTIFDDGDMLYVGAHSREDFHYLSAFDLKGEGRSWSEGACGEYTFLKKEKIIADNGVWAGGFVHALTPQCFNKVGQPHIPVLRYEYHTWGGRPIVFLGHNAAPEGDADDWRRDGWRKPISGPTSFLLGDFLHSDDEDYREDTFVQILPAGPDGISVYEIQQQGISLSDDGVHLSRGSKKTVAYGFIGLTRPFFTEPLFEEAGSVQNEMAEVTIDGAQKRLTLRQLQSQDPFMQPDIETDYIPEEPRDKAETVSHQPAPVAQPDTENEEEIKTRKDPDRISRDFERKPEKEEVTTQEITVVSSDPIPFQLVEEKPTFNGGDANEFTQWIKANLVYPEKARNNKVQGRTMLQFQINPGGVLSDVSVLRSSGDLELDQEAVRVVSSSPKWKPGKQRGRAVAVTYTFPVYFSIDASSVSDSVADSPVSSSSEPNRIKGYEWLEGEWYGDWEDGAEAARMVITKSYYQIVSDRDGDQTKDVRLQEKNDISIKRTHSSLFEFTGLSLAEENEYLWIAPSDHTLFRSMSEYGPDLIFHKVGPADIPDKGFQGDLKYYSWMEGDWYGSVWNYDYHLRIFPDGYQLALRDEPFSQATKEPLHLTIEQDQDDRDALTIGDGIYLDVINQKLYMPVGPDRVIGFERENPWE